MIYAQSSENSDEPTFTTIPLVACTSSDFTNIQDISVLGRVRPSPDREDSALYKDLYCPDFKGALDNNPLLTLEEVGTLMSQYTRVNSNYLALVIRSNVFGTTVNESNLEPLRVILYASTTDIDQQDLEESEDEVEPLRRRMVEVLHSTVTTTQR